MMKKLALVFAAFASGSVATIATNYFVLQQDTPCLDRNGAVSSVGWDQKGMCVTGEDVKIIVTPNDRANAPNYELMSDIGESLARALMADHVRRHPSPVAP